MCATGFGMVGHVWVWAVLWSSPHNCSCRQENIITSFHQKSLSHFLKGHTRFVCTKFLQLNNCQDRKSVKYLSDFSRLQYVLDKCCVYQCGMLWTIWLLLGGVAVISSTGRVWGVRTHFGAAYGDFRQLFKGTNSQRWKALVNSKSSVQSFTIFPLLSFGYRKKARNFTKKERYRKKEENITQEKMPEAQ